MGDKGMLIILRRAFLYFGEKCFFCTTGWIVPMGIKKLGENNFSPHNKTIGRFMSRKTNDIQNKIKTLARSKKR